MTDTLPFSNFESLMTQVQDLVATSIDEQSESKQFLRLHLVPETTALLAVQNLTEVLTIPVGQIAPIPHLPAWVMGVYNWRGESLWMIDLGHLCGLTPWFQQAGNLSVHTAVVLNEEGVSTEKSQKLGLVVSRVEEIEWCDPQQIRSLPSANRSDLKKFAAGYWPKANGDVLTVLDGDAILAAMPQ